MTTHPHRIRQLVVGAGLAALTLVGSLDPAGAAEHGRRPRPPVLSMSSGGTYTLDADGTAVVIATGELTGRRGNPEPVQVKARMAAADGTLPEPGVCEPGTATVIIRQDEHLVAKLTGTGDVCGHWIQPPTYYVTHVFTGRYDVVRGERKLVGTDGWYQVILGETGTAGVDAYDT